jgi:hypothetical protein
LRHNHAVKLQNGREQHLDPQLARRLLKGLVDQRAEQPQRRTNRKKRFIPSLALSLVLTAICGSSVLPLFARSHPDYTPAAFAFPYGLWAVHLLEDDILLLPLVLIQFPAYAIIVQSSRSPERMAVRIIALHIIFAVSCVLLYKANQSF